jgi:WD40 repeat protein
MRLLTVRLFPCILCIAVLLSACSPNTGIPAATPTVLIETQQNTATPEETPQQTITDAYPAADTQNNKPTSSIEDAYPAPSSPDKAAPMQENALDLMQSMPISEPQRLVWSPDAANFALIGYDTLTYYAFPSLEKLYEYQSVDGKVLLDAANDGQRFAISSNNNIIQVNNWKTGEQTTFSVDFGFMAAKFSPDNRQLLFTLMDERAAMLVNITTGDTAAKLDGFETAAPVYDVRFAADGEHLLWFARATLQISDIESNTMGQAFNHEDFIASFTSDPQNSVVVTSAGAMEEDQFKPFIFFWDPQSGELFNQMEVTQPAYSMAFSPDGKTLAISQEGEINLLDVNNQTITRAFTAHQEGISQLVFSPDGTVLSSIGSDQVIKFWKMP